jgi:hypothetical protein
MKLGVVVVEGVAIKEPPGYSMRLLLAIYAVLAASPAFGMVEVFAKGSASKNYLSRDSWTVSVSATTGLAISLFKGVRLEGRYTNISALQNRLEIATSSVTVNLHDVKTTTSIYSLGLDIEPFSEKFPFQPFLFLGAGYIETERSYYYRVTGDAEASFAREPLQKGISANVGIGFRLRIARAVAFEIEMFGYGTDVDKANPLVNLYGTAGIRIFL